MMLGNVPTIYRLRLFQEQDEKIKKIISGDSLKQFVKE
jgi:hypothetical protein